MKAHAKRFGDSALGPRGFPKEFAGDILEGIVAELLHVPNVPVFLTASLCYLTDSTLIPSQAGGSANAHSRHAKHMPGSISQASALPMPAKPGSLFLNLQHLPRLLGMEIRGQLQEHTEGHACEGSTAAPIC